MHALLHVCVEDASALHLGGLLRPRVQVVEKATILAHVAQPRQNNLKRKLDWQLGQVVEDLVDELVVVHLYLRVQSVGAVEHIILQVLGD